MTVSFAKAKASETAISHNNRSLDPDHFDFDKAGHRFDQAQITDLSLFEQQWPQSDLRTLRQQIAPIPTTTQIRQNSLQELNDLDDDQGFDR